MLDKLRKLDAQASPEPWTADAWATETRYVYDNADRTLGYAVFARSPRGTHPRIAWIHSVDPEMAQQSRANAQLAALSHHILPLAEALEIHQHAVGAGVLCGPCRVLAQLEEALK